MRRREARAERELRRNPIKHILGLNLEQYPHLPNEASRCKCEPIRSPTCFLLQSIKYIAMGKRHNICKSSEVLNERKGAKFMKVHRVHS